MNCQVNDCDSFGIKLSSCSDIFVFRNTIYNNGWMGISLSMSSGCEVVENKLYNNSVVGISLFRSNTTKLDNNEVYLHYSHGISGGYCNESDIQNNYIHDNKEGVYLYESDSNTVSYNTIANNTDYGVILLYHSDYNIISQNSLSGSKYCITIGSSCNKNEVYDNGDCQLFTLHETVDNGGESNNGDGNDDEDADEDHPENVAVGGYSFVFIIAFTISGMILFLLLKFRSIKIID